MASARPAQGWELPHVGLKHASCSALERGRGDRASDTEDGKAAPRPYTPS